MRLVPASGEDHETALRQMITSRVRVRHRDHAVPLRPDDHRRNVVGKVLHLDEGATLSGGCDDRPQRGEERGSPGLVAQRLFGSAQVDDVLRSQTQRAMQAGSPVEPPHPRPHRGVEQQRSSGHSGGAKHEMHFLAETACRHQHEPTYALGIVVREVHRDRTAQRVPADRRVLDAGRGEERVQRRREIIELIAAGRLVGASMAEQIDGDHLQPAIGERQDRAVPGVAVGGEAVDEHDDGALVRTGLLVGQHPSESHDRPALDHAVRHAR